uniref:Uncharacterized protein n=1 Tax=Panagrolaimus superbus TaxID=310955 RepID=A0A914YS59_9BILA
MKNFYENRKKKLQILVNGILFTTNHPSDDVEIPRRCVTAINSTTAVTYSHGNLHSTYKEGKEVNIYPFGQEDDKPITVTVLDSNENVDVVIFRRKEGEFLIFPPSIVSEVFTGDEYFAVGISGNKPTVNVGNIKKICGKFYFGSSDTKLGDSGAAVLSKNKFAFMGMIKGRVSFENLNSTKKAAYHSPGAVIIPSIPILSLMPENEVKCDISASIL